MKTLKDLFLDQLADMYDAEQRIVRALPKLAKAATSANLRAAFLSHLKETEGHAKTLELVFKAFGKSAKGKKCEATVGLLEEGDEMTAEFKGTPAIDAALISAAQKVEHYEMASYGCLHEWAGLLGNDQGAGLLEQILEEEKAANETLTELARSGGNEEALGEGGATDSSGKGNGSKPENTRRNMRLPKKSSRSHAVSMTH